MYFSIFIKAYLLLFYFIFQKVCKLRAILHFIYELKN